LQDYELIAQELERLGGKLNGLENRLSDILTRLGDVEKVNRQLEDAALMTSRALAEISGHWDAVYEAMRRNETQPPKK
jgi:hypothetical protein